MAYAYRPKATVHFRFLKKRKRKGEDKKNVTYSSLLNASAKNVTFSDSFSIVNGHIKLQISGTVCTYKDKCLNPSSLVFLFNTSFFFLLHNFPKSLCQRCKKNYFVFYMSIWRMTSFSHLELIVTRQLTCHSLLQIINLPSLRFKQSEVAKKSFISIDNFLLCHR